MKKGHQFQFILKQNTPPNVSFKIKEEPAESQIKNDLGDVYQLITPIRFHFGIS